MARILTETLGELLYIPTDFERSGNLPSPEFLRGKSVIKGKRPPDPDHGDETEDNTNNDEEDPYEATESAAGGKKAQSSSADPAKKPKIVPELARLTLFHGRLIRYVQRCLVGLKLLSSP